MMGAAMLKRHQFVRASGGGRNVCAGESGAALVVQADITVHRC